MPWRNARVYALEEAKRNRGCGNSYDDMPTFGLQDACPTRDDEQAIV